MRVRDFIRDRDLLSGHTRVVVAVSGGPDSVCLLSVLTSLREELGITLHVAHLDHGLRGSDSQADATFVDQLARRWGLPATVEKRDVSAYRARRRISLEEAAREVRYAFLADVAGLTGATAVAVGHTSDDNVETILMHLIRGTGSRGLRGLLAANRLPTVGGGVQVVRPLLETSRVETARFCAGRGQEVRVDTSNQSLSLFRNRVRLELVPLLRKYNPRVDEALLRTGRIAADEHAFLDGEAGRLWDGVAARSQDTIVFDRDRLLGLSPAIQRQMVRKALEKLAGDIKDIESGHVERLLEAAVGPAGRTIQLPGGLVWVAEYGRCLLGPDTTVACPLPAFESGFGLTVPGETAGSGWMVNTVVLAREPGQQVTVPAGAGGVGVSPGAGPEPWRVLLDFDRVGDKLAVRALLPGDRFRPLGLGQEKKVGRFMLDARIPRSWRKRVPIVVADGRPAWVVGWRIDEGVKVTERTKTILDIEFRLASDSR
jgi:tRNA(Ile)-lysidine synthase